MAVTATLNKLDISVGSPSPRIFTLKFGYLYYTSRNALKG